MCSVTYISTSCPFQDSSLGLWDGTWSPDQKEQDVSSNRGPSPWRGFLRSWEEYPATTHTYTILLSRKSQVPSTEYVLVSQELCSTADNPDSK